MKSLPYTIRRYTRSKYIRISVGEGGKVLVSAPKRVSLKEINRFVESRQEWIVNAQDEMLAHNKAEKKKRLPCPPLQSCKARAKKLISERLKFYNEYYNFEYKRISIRNQKTRWGSCSSTGCLSFSYKLFCLPPELCDYVVVHELCHTKEMNHSQRFWDLVAKTIPDHKQKRAKLRKIHI